MNRYRAFFVLSFLLAAVFGKAQTQAEYTNPVLKVNCPDPTVLDDRERTGWFYVYSTQTTVDGLVNKDSSSATGESEVINLPVYRSKDMINWEFVCDGFPYGRPSWVEGSNLWAPDINYFDGKYVLYYALGKWGAIFQEGSGVAVSDSPTGPFIDKGKVVDFKSLGTLNSIDPNFFDDGEEKYILWGSLGGGIDIVRLSDDGLSVAEGAKKKHLSARNMEAAYLYKRDGFYYLFASKGSCCAEEESTYRLVVARSEDIEGPYVSPSGQKFTSLSYDHVILEADRHGEFIGPGHNAQIITDSQGQDWMFYHSYWKGTGYKGRCLNLGPVFWDEEGWPYFKDGVPSGSGVKPILQLDDHKKAYK